MTKTLCIPILVASLLCTCRVAVAADRTVSFKVEETLPEGHAAWLMSFKLDGNGQDLRIEVGQWSSPIEVDGTTPRILVGACHDDECSGMRVFGEMLPITLTGNEGEVLVSNLVIGDVGVPFEIRLRWSSPASEQDQTLTAPALNDNAR